MIGVFDSGYGGLTVFKPLSEYFLEYDLIYFGDNARAPYGDKTQEEIYKFTKQAVDWLFKEGCKLIILACNTASSSALRRIQQELADKKVLGVLVPVAEKVAFLEGKIGILATEATVESGAYLREIKKLNPDAKIIQQAAPLLVPLIEAGKIESNEIKKAIKNYLEVFKKENIKDIILGCTHYPLIKNLIQTELQNARIFDSPSVIPAALENYLARHPEIEKRLSKNGGRRYITTGDPENFSKFAREYLDIEILPNKVNI